MTIKITKKDGFLRLVTFSLVLAFAIGSASVVSADGDGVLVLIDPDSISSSTDPGGFTTQDLNDELAAVGMRDALPYFRRNVGESVTLKTGRGQNPGWFGLLSTPSRWATGPNENDGLVNFVLAGAGLGSAEDSGDRTRLLSDAGIAALSSANIQALQGRDVCGVVYQSDLTPAQTGANLSGRTLGLVAFRITSVTAVEGSSFPSVQVRILDSADVCDGNIMLPQLGQ